MIALNAEVSLASNFKVKTPFLLAILTWEREVAGLAASGDIALNMTSKFLSELNLRLITACAFISLSHAG